MFDEGGNYCRRAKAARNLSRISKVLQGRGGGRLRIIVLTCFVYFGSLLINEELVRRCVVSSPFLCGLVPTMKSRIRNHRWVFRFGEMAKVENFVSMLKRIDVCFFTL